MIGLEKFVPSERDTWTWSLATFEDIADIVSMAQTLFQVEIETFMAPDPALFARNLAISVAKQAYSLYDEQLIVARNKTTNMLMAWAWIGRGGYTPYSRDEMAEAKFAHMDLALPMRTRITLLAQMLHQWYAWASVCRIPVLVSTSIREDQTGFMNLHRAAGFTIRGSIGYLKV
jgi:hypothetical protein